MGRAELQKLGTGERFKAIALDRHRIFSFHYLKIIGKTGEWSGRPLIVFLIFCIFRSKGEIKAGDNKFASGSVWNDITNAFWIPDPRNSLPVAATKGKDPFSELLSLSPNLTSQNIHFESLVIEQKHK